MKLDLGNKTKQTNIKKKTKLTFHCLANISLVYLWCSGTVCFWYDIWCFVLKESLWWSYTDLSWKSRLSFRGWCSKRKRQLQTERNIYFLRSKSGFLVWSPDSCSAWHSAGCWPKWLHHGGDTRVPHFGRGGWAGCTFFSAQWGKNMTYILWKQITQKKVNLWMSDSRSQ